MTTSMNVGDEFLFDDGRRGVVDIDGIPVTKLGFDTMRRLTKKLCGAVQKFAPLLRRVLPDDSPVLLFLEVTELVCAWANVWLEPLANDQPVSVADSSLPDLVADLRSLVDKWEDKMSGTGGA
jgi:hypothetical protein